MPESEALYALAEIAVAMAGFSSIVVLFKRSDSGTWNPADADRFHGMLLHSMAAVFFCLFPSLVAVFAGSEAAVWTIASAVLGAQVLLHSVVIFNLPSTRGAARLAIVLALGVVVLQILNILAIHFAREFRPYLVGVLWHLLHAGGLFVGLVWVRSSEDPSA